MRVLLIYPPNHNNVKVMMLETIKEEIGIKPPIGILCIGSYLEKNSRYEVLLHDCQLNSKNYDDLLEKIEKIKPEVVGITAWTDFWYDIKTLMDKIKQIDQNIKICLGGPHTTVFPRETLLFSQTDAIVIGDGEEPFLDYLNYIENKNYQLKYENHGLYLKKFVNKYSEFVAFVAKNLDDFPIIDRRHLPYEKYTSVLAKNSRVTTMITSRGCPFACTFCKIDRTPIRLRSVENIVKELKDIASLKIKEIEIYDDTFTISKQRVMDLCDLILANDLKFIWACRDRVSSADEDMYRKMYQAGCRRIYLGIESGNNDILKRTHKMITVEQAKNAVELAKKVGFEIITYFMIGLPGETKKEVMETINLACKLNTDFASFSVTIPYPGTALYKEALAKKIIPYDYWLEYVGNPQKEYAIPYFYEENLSKEELGKLRDLGIKKFYFSLKHLLKNALKTKSPIEFFKKAVAGFKILKEIFR